MSEVITSDKIVHFKPLKVALKPIKCNKCFIFVRKSHTSKWENFGFQTIESDTLCFKTLLIVLFLQGILAPARNFAISDNCEWHFCLYTYKDMFLSGKLKNVEFRQLNVALGL